MRVRMPAGAPPLRLLRRWLLRLPIALLGEPALPVAAAGRANGGRPTSFCLTT